MHLESFELLNVFHDDQLQFVGGHARLPGHSKFKLNGANVSADGHYG